METEKSPEIAKRFYCEKCDYECGKESDYKKHTSTRKHNSETTGNSSVIENSPYVCECGKEYKTRSGLFKHKKICSFGKTEDTRETRIEYLMKENLEMKKDNLEMKKMILDLQKKMEPNSEIKNHTAMFRRLKTSHKCRKNRENM